MSLPSVNFSSSQPISHLTSASLSVPSLVPVRSTGSDRMLASDIQNRQTTQPSSITTRVLSRITTPTAVNVNSSMYSPHRWHPSSGHTQADVLVAANRESLSKRSQQSRYDVAVGHSGIPPSQYPINVDVGYGGLNSASSSLASFTNAFHANNAHTHSSMLASMGAMGSTGPSQTPFVAPLTSQSQLIAPPLLSTMSNSSTTSLTDVRANPAPPLDSNTPLASSFAFRGQKLAPPALFSDRSMGTLPAAQFFNDKSLSGQMYGDKGFSASSLSSSSLMHTANDRAHAAMHRQERGIYPPQASPTAALTSRLGMDGGFGASGLTSLAPPLGMLSRHSSLSQYNYFAHAHAHTPTSSMNAGMGMGGGTGTSALPSMAFNGGGEYGYNAGATASAYTAAAYGAHAHAQGMREPPVPAHHHAHAPLPQGLGKQISRTAVAAANHAASLGVGVDGNAPPSSVSGSDGDGGAATYPRKSNKRKRRAMAPGSLKKSKQDNSPRRICISCRTRHSSYWREPWAGAVACNACTLRYKKRSVACETCLFIPFKNDNANETCRACNAGRFSSPEGRPLPAHIQSLIEPNAAPAASGSSSPCLPAQGDGVLAVADGDEGDGEGEGEGEEEEGGDASGDQGDSETGSEAPALTPLASIPGHADRPSVGDSDEFHMPLHGHGAPSANNTAHPTPASAPLPTHERNRAPEQGLSPTGLFAPVDADVVVPHPYHAPAPPSLVAVARPSAESARLAGRTVVSVSAPASVRTAAAVGDGVDMLTLPLPAYSALTPQGRVRADSVDSRPSL